MHVLVDRIQADRIVPGPGLEHELLAVEDHLHRAGALSDQCNPLHSLGQRSRLDSGDAQLRETLDLCAEAKTLIEFCATELAAVDKGLKELKLEDLAQSLSPGQETAPVPETPPAPDSIEEAPPAGDDEVPF